MKGMLVNWPWRKLTMEHINLPSISRNVFYNADIIFDGLLKWSILITRIELEWWSNENGKLQF